MMTCIAYGCRRKRADDNWRARWCEEHRPIEFVHPVLMDGCPRVYEEES